MIFETQISTETNKHHVGLHKTVSENTYSRQQTFQKLFTDCIKKQQLHFHRRVGYVLKADKLVLCNCGTSLWTTIFTLPHIRAVPTPYTHVHPPKIPSGNRSFARIVSQRSP